MVISIGYSTSFTQGITLLLFIHSLSENQNLHAISAKLLSEYSGIPLPTTNKTLKSLNAAKLIASKEGANGGNLLLKPISQITLLDIFMAIEQDAPLFKMHTAIPCEHPYIDNLKDRVSICLTKASDAMKATLSEITLDNILTGDLNNE